MAWGQPGEKRACRRGRRRVSRFVAVVVVEHPRHAVRRRWRRRRTHEDDVLRVGYSGQVDIEGIDLSLREGLAGQFPIKRANLVGHMWALAAYEATSAEDLTAVVEPAVSDLERRLDVAEAELRRRTS